MSTVFHAGYRAMNSFFNNGPMPFQRAPSMDGAVPVATAVNLGLVALFRIHVLRTTVISCTASLVTWGARNSACRGNHHPRAPHLETISKPPKVLSALGHGTRIC